MLRQRLHQQAAKDVCALVLSLLCCQKEGSARGKDIDHVSVVPCSRPQRQT